MGFEPTDEQAHHLISSQARSTGLRHLSVVNQGLTASTCVRIVPWCLCVCHAASRQVSRMRAARESPETAYPTSTPELASHGRRAQLLSAPEASLPRGWQGPPTGSRVCRTLSSGCAAPTADQPPTTHDEIAEIRTALAVLEESVGTRAWWPDSHNGVVCPEFFGGE